MPENMKKILDDIMKKSKDTRKTLCKELTKELKRARNCGDNERAQYIAQMIRDIKEAPRMAKKAQRPQLAQLKRWKQQKPHSPSLSPEARYTFEYLKEETQELIEDPAFQRSGR